MAAGRSWQGGMGAAVGKRMGIELHRIKERQDHESRNNEVSNFRLKLRLSQARSIAVVAHVAGRAWVHAKAYNWS